MDTERFITDDTPQIQQVEDASVEVLPDNPQDFISDKPVSEEYQSQQQEAETYQQQENWEHKYRVLKGKYDKEVPRLQKEINLLKREKEQLIAKLELLETVIKEQQLQQKQATENIEDEDVELLKKEYPEIYKAIEKLLSKKITPQIEQVKQASSQELFFAKLSSIVPDWQKLNTDPDFLDWLAQPSEEIPSKTRHQLMLQLFNEGDVEGVAQFFIKYKRLTQRQPAKAQGDVMPTTRKQNSEYQASKRLFKESEIKRFYTDVALGKYSQQERERIEKEITQAVLENRILYGQ